MSDHKERRNWVRQELESAWLIAKVIHNLCRMIFRGVAGWKDATECNQTSLKSGPGTGRDPPIKRIHSRVVREHKLPDKSLAPDLVGRPAQFPIVASQKSGR